MKTDLIAKYGNSTKWADEVRRRAIGLKLELTEDFFFHMNPLYEPQLAIQYVVGRYEAAYDALAQIRPKSVLEIGCAQGLSTWLMTSWSDSVTGLDISEDRISVGRHVFPEVDWVVSDWSDYLADGKRFDVIVNSHGPVRSDSRLLAACDNYIYVGYRTKSWREAFRGSHKLPGKQLSFSTTISGKDADAVSSRYGHYFLRRNWVKEARHALMSGYALPI